MQFDNQNQAQMQSNNYEVASDVEDCEEDDIL